jgi:hypothetical protein
MLGNNLLLRELMKRRLMFKMNFMVTCYDNFAEKVPLRDVPMDSKCMVTFIDRNYNVLIENLPIRVGSFIESWEEGKYDCRGIYEGIIYPVESGRNNES